MDENYYAESSGFQMIQLTFLPSFTNGITN